MMESKPMMPFPDAIKSCWRQYAGFGGRATRAEYWWWVLGTTAVSAILLILDGLIFGFGGSSAVVFRPIFGLALLLPDWAAMDGVIFGFLGDSPAGLQTVFWLAILLPSLAVTARRLHDIGRTGWWQLLWYGIAIVGALTLAYALTAGFGIDRPPGPAWGGWVLLLLTRSSLALWEIWWLGMQGLAGPNKHGADPRALDSYQDVHQDVPAPNPQPAAEPRALDA